jgi:hypothetical protein
MNVTSLASALALSLVTACAAQQVDDTGPDAGDVPPGSFAVVDTGQDRCYDTASETDCAGEGLALFGQDADYVGNQPAYVDNDDGTITDEVTGLIWAQAAGDKLTWEEALAEADSMTLGGYDDWRLPTIKELYSLIDFRGGFHETADASVPYIDTDYFEFFYGDESAGERPIDVQTWTATEYVSTTMWGDETVFGVNFADGRIKGYPKYDPQTGFSEGYTLFARYVRGNLNYGFNSFADGGDGTVIDDATGLTWQQADAGAALSWEDALAYCESLEHADSDEWRLPNAKELQTIVDYDRSPMTSDSAAIDPVFSVTDLESYYWTSTTHLDGPVDMMGTAAVYIAFGRALGYMQGMGSSDYELLDVHGAGAQRSDPKVGDPDDYPTGHGPQGDDIRIYNAVRCVR